MQGPTWGKGVFTGEQEGRGKLRQEVRGRWKEVNFFIQEESGKGQRVGRRELGKT